jgi:hypothetical protein
VSVKGHDSTRTDERAAAVRKAARQHGYAAVAATGSPRTGVTAVADVCVDLLGLEPPGEGEDPFYSKRVYVRGRLLNKSIAEMEAMARKIIDEYGDEALEQIIEQLGMTGVAGELKNLIFAANGPKPRIVLHDAVNNVIEITENAEFCLVYDQPLTRSGAVVARADGLVDVEVRPDRKRARQGTQPVPPPRREYGRQRVRASLVQDVRRALRDG